MNGGGDADQSGGQIWPMTSGTYRQHPEGMWLVFPFLWDSVSLPEMGRIFILACAHPAWTLS